jgi:Uma2 family endonuclease
VTRTSEVILVSVLPVAQRLLTVAGYLALGEPESGYTELVEGRAVASPSASRQHNRCCFEAAVQLRAQVPPHLEVLMDTDVDLQLAPADAPGFVRRPDILVARRGTDLLSARDVVLVVEVVSPGSVRTDDIIKRSEYADAGIRHYWIVDLTEPVSVLACHLAGSFGYADSGAVTGAFEAGEPFPVRLDLDSLL